MSINAQFDWQCQPKADNLLIKILQDCGAKNGAIMALEQDLERHTSSRLFDWIDHLVVRQSPGIEEQLEEVGFVVDLTTSTYRVYHHPGAQFPRVQVREDEQAPVGVAVTVENIADYLMVRGLSSWIEGAPLSSYRRCCVATEKGVSLWVVERRGTTTMEPTYPDEPYLEKILEATEKWQCRPRGLEDENESMRRSVLIAEEIVNSVGRDTAAWIVLESERKYWQAKNTAAQMQKNRQDRRGMGWANHDHHTFRSSRRHFPMLVRLYETLGFHCRERFYAGEEAGWGAQVMENPNCKLILFLDLDLAPHEVHGDFAHHALPDLDRLGTVGLWCALHGDSILKGGMHHLEAQFLFEGLTQDLAHLGIGMMEPFSSFPYLKQAFTQGEVWQVNPKRVEHLVQKGLVTHEQADKFVTYGAVGSHLENLQRREGYKGFNKTNVSFIIQQTDPRRMNAKR